MPTPQTIRCYYCGHQFDHDPKFSKHCKCKSCRVSISIPLARSEYVRYSTPMAQRAPAPAQPYQGSAPPPRHAPTPDYDGLPPAVRDNDGQPYKAAPREVRSPEKPRHVADDYAAIARGLKALQAEKAAHEATKKPEPLPITEDDLTF